MISCLLINTDIAVSYVGRTFDIYLNCNRWKYDSSRGMAIETKNPLKARDVLTAVPKQHTDFSGHVEGSRLEDGKSSRILQQRLQ